MPTRSRRRTRPPRSTAPLWTKATIVLSGLVIVAVLFSLFDTDDVSFWVLAVLAVLTVVASVGGTSKVLGVHLGLRSRD